MAEQSIHRNLRHATVLLLKYKYSGKLMASLNFLFNKTQFLFNENIETEISHLSEISVSIYRNQDQKQIQRNG